MEVSYKKEAGNIRLLRINLIFLYILNISDLFFTKFLLKQAPELFTEANIILNPIIDGAIPYILKIFVAGAVLIYWYIRSKSSTEKEIKRSLFVSKIMLFGYGCINCLHIFNLILLISL